MIDDLQVFDAFSLATLPFDAAERVIRESKRDGGLPHMRVAHESRGPGPRRPGNAPRRGPVGPRDSARDSAPDYGPNPDKPSAPTADGERGPEPREYRPRTEYRPDGAPKPRERAYEKRERPVRTRAGKPDGAKPESAYARKKREREEKGGGNE
jgi:hypothetical protein